MTTSLTFFEEKKLKLCVWLHTQLFYILTMLTKSKEKNKLDTSFSVDKNHLLHEYVNNKDFNNQNT